ncbi:unnamed protein product [Amoebophrya sp. A25]|nr:unnamed protein product [Amoebophrya sp. A25]|eukprot:GSA25T00016440001.1
MPPSRGTPPSSSSKGTATITRSGSPEQGVKKVSHPSSKVPVVHTGIVESRMKSRVAFRMLVQFGYKPQKDGIILVERSTANAELFDSLLALGMHQGPDGAIRVCKSPSAQLLGGGSSHKHPSIASVVDPTTSAPKYPFLAALEKEGEPEEADLSKEIGDSRLAQPEGDSKLEQPAEDIKDTNLRSAARQACEVRVAEARNKHFDLSKRKVQEIYNDNFFIDDGVAGDMNFVDEFFSASGVDSHGGRLGVSASGVDSHGRLGVANLCQELERKLEAREQKEAAACGGGGGGLGQNFNLQGGGSAGGRNSSIPTVASTSEGGSAPRGKSRISSNNAAIKENKENNNPNLKPPVLPHPPTTTRSRKNTDASTLSSARGRRPTSGKAASQHSVGEQGSSAASGSGVVTGGRGSTTTATRRSARSRTESGSRMPNASPPTRSIAGTPRSSPSCAASSFEYNAGPGVQMHQPGFVSATSSKQKWCKSTATSSTHNTNAMPTVMASPTTAARYRLQQFANEYHVASKEQVLGGNHLANDLHGPLAPSSVSSSSYTTATSGFAPSGVASSVNHGVNMMNSGVGNHQPGGVINVNPSTMVKRKPSLDTMTRIFFRGKQKKPKEDPDAVAARAAVQEMFDRLAKPREVASNDKDKTRLLAANRRYDSVEEQNAAVSRLMRKKNDSSSSSKEQQDHDVEGHIEGHNIDGLSAQLHQGPSSGTPPAGDQQQNQRGDLLPKKPRVGAAYRTSMLPPKPPPPQRRRPQVAFVSKVVENKKPAARFAWLFSKIAAESKVLVNFTNLEPSTVRGLVEEMLWTGMMIRREQESDTVSKQLLDRLPNLAQVALWLYQNEQMLSSWVLTKIETELPLLFRTLTTSAGSASSSLAKTRQNCSTSQGQHLPGPSSPEHNYIPGRNEAAVRLAEIRKTKDLDGLVKMDDLVKVRDYLLGLASAMLGEEDEEEVEDEVGVDQEERILDNGEQGQSEEEQVAVAENQDSSCAPPLPDDAPAIVLGEEPPSSKPTTKREVKKGGPTPIASPGEEWSVEESTTEEGGHSSSSAEESSCAESSCAMSSSSSSTEDLLEVVTKRQQLVASEVDDNAHEDSPPPAPGPPFSTTSAGAPDTSPPSEKNSNITSPPIKGNSPPPVSSRDSPPPVSSRDSPPPVPSSRSHQPFEEGFPGSLGPSPACKMPSDDYGYQRMTEWTKKQTRSHSPKAPPQAPPQAAPPMAAKSAYSPPQKGRRRFIMKKPSGSPSAECTLISAAGRVAPPVSNLHSSKSPRKSNMSYWLFDDKDGQG